MTRRQEWAAVLVALVLILAATFAAARTHTTSEPLPTSRPAVVQIAATPEPTAAPTPRATAAATVRPTPAPQKATPAMPEAKAMKAVRACPASDAGESCRRAILEPIVREAWPEPASVEGIVGRIHCESRWTPWLVSRTNDHGITQVNAPTWRRHFGARWAHVYEVAANVGMAYDIYRSAGGSFSPWVCGAS